MPEIENKLLDEKRLTAMKVNILELEKENLKIVIRLMTNGEGDKEKSYLMSLKTISR